MQKTEEDDAEAAAAEAVAEAVEAGTDDVAIPDALTRDEDAAEAEEPSDEDGEGAAAEQPPGSVGASPLNESKSLYAQVLSMSMPEKVKLALRGSKEARILLARDGSKTIRRFVLQNPRISDEEVIMLAKDKQADEEMLRTVMQKREWMKLYQVRFALVGNPRTPLPAAMRMLGTLLMRDVERVAKSRDVPQGVAVQARRLVLEARKRSGG